MKKVLLVFVLFASCFSNTMYLNKNINIKLENKVIANAILLSPVNVLDKSGDIYKVEIVGYVNSNYQEEIVKGITQSERYACFHDTSEKVTYKGDKNPYINIIEKVEDDYGDVWYKVSIRFEVTSSDLVQNVNGLHNEARILYEQSCSSCHHLHDTKEYTVSQWPSSFESMVGSGFVELDEEDKLLIIKYLQQNAKDVK